jgi:hypothetical protein
MPSRQAYSRLCVRHAALSCTGGSLPTLHSASYLDADASCVVGRLTLLLRRPVGVVDKALEALDTLVSGNEVGLEALRQAGGESILQVPTNQA